MSFLIAISAASCVSKKKYKDLQSQLTSNNDELKKVKFSQKGCGEELAASKAKTKALEDQVAYLKANNSELINNAGNLTTLTKKGAENLEKSLESLKEKDTKITRLQDALTKKDSVTIAIVTSLKGALGNTNSDDIEINVEKGVVFISIADKLLFKSGSYSVTDQAKVVLGKVAVVVKNKPDFEVMVEGHTDNVPYTGDVLLDNWDLSVKRSTAIVRILQNDFKIDPDRMIAAGRSSYVPLVPNDTPENKAKNRRTRIVVLPKIDQFYNMIEEGMKTASKPTNMEFK